MSRSVKIGYACVCVCVRYDYQPVWIEWCRTAAVTVVLYTRKRSIDINKTKEEDDDEIS